MQSKIFAVSATNAAKNLVGMLVQQYRNNWQQASLTMKAIIALKALWSVLQLVFL